jgi:hypothetical protein
MLRPGPTGLVRPQDPACPGQALRRCPDLSRSGDSPSLLPALWCRETGKVSFLADSSLYTKRFAYYVGRRCRSATVKDVAKELRLDWSTVKALEMQSMGWTP